jgi:hypothetical protein
VSAATVAAIVDRIKSTGLRCHDAAPTSPTYPYVVVYADGGIRSSDREADVRVQVDLNWQTTVVGESPAQCRAALDRVVGALSDWRPAVTGRAFHKVEHLSSQPVRVDEDLPDRSLFIATDQWRVVSDPV